MKKIILVLMLTVSGWAQTHHDILCIGNSITSGRPGFIGPEDVGGPTGNPESQYMPKMLEVLGTDQTWYNAGIGGNYSSSVVARIDTLLLSHTPDTVYLMVGINDINVPFDINVWYSNVDSIRRTVATNSTAQLIVSQILPVNSINTDETKRRNVLKFNAKLERWALRHNIPMAFPHQFFRDTIVGRDNKTIAGLYVDSLHPNVAGYQVLGDRMARAVVPQNFRWFGHPNFPNAQYESWRGLKGGNRSGDTDTGSVNINNGDSVRLPVICVDGELTKFKVSPSVLSGSVEIYYRTADSAYDDTSTYYPWRKASADSGIFYSRNQFQFIQIKLVAISNAVVGDCKISWSYDPVDDIKQSPYFEWISTRSDKSKYTGLGWVSVDLTKMSSNFWKNIDNNGMNILVTDSIDNPTSHYVGYINLLSKNGELIFQCSTSTAKNHKYKIWYGESGSYKKPISPFGSSCIGAWNFNRNPYYVDDIPNIVGEGGNVLRQPSLQYIDWENWKYKKAHKFRTANDEHITDTLNSAMRLSNTDFTVVMLLKTHPTMNTLSQVFGNTGSNGHWFGFSNNKSLAIISGQSYLKTNTKRTYDPSTEYMITFRFNHTTKTLQYYTNNEFDTAVVYSNTPSVDAGKSVVFGHNAQPAPIGLILADVQLYNTMLDTNRIFDIYTNYWDTLYTVDTVYQSSSETAPTISTHPTSDLIRFGQSCTLTVVASGTDTLSYQWQYYSEGWQDSGSTDNDTFIVASPDTGVYNYRVIVSNSLGADTSDSAEITVYWPQFTVDTSIVGSGTLTLSPQGLTQDSSTMITFTGMAGDGYAGDTVFNITLLQDTSVTVTFLQHPVIDSIRNNPEYYGERISIYGSGFLSEQGTGFIVIEDDTLVDVEMWTDTHIIDTIPEDMERGYKELQINNNNNLTRSSKETLRVLRPYAR